MHPLKSKKWKITSPCANLRVALFSNMYPSSDNAAYGKFIHNQVKEIQKLNGVDIHLNISRRSVDSIAAKIIKYIRLHVKSWSVIKFRPDVIHLHYPSPFHLLAVGLVLLIMRAPVVFTVHRGERDYLRHSRMARLIISFFFKHCSALICVSAELLDYLQAHIDLPNNCYVMNVGCDLSRFRSKQYSEKKILRLKFNIPRNKFIVLFIGHLIWRKGLDILIKAIKNTNCQSSILAVIIGKGILEKRLRSCICAEGLGDQFLIVGQKKHSELPQWYNLADVFVLPSRGEGTPTVLLEAMSTGLPIISTNVGGIPEILKDGESALFFPPEDYNRLANHLDTLFADSALRKKLSLNARKNINNHSITGHAKKLIEIYKYLIQLRRLND